MNRGAVLGIFAAVVSWQALAEGVLPRDVSRFVTARDRCDHFRGEYPYDEERRRFLDKNMRTYCVGTDKQLAALKYKYRSEPTVLAKLDEYDSTIEPHAQK